MSRNPYETPAKPDNPFSGEPSGPAGQVYTGPGMVNSVVLVCIFMIVQGVLALIMGLFLAGYGLFFPMLMSYVEETSPEEQFAGPSPAEMYMVSGIMLVFGLPIVVSGLLQIVAGIRNLRFRGRVLGIIALLSNIPAILSCYCAPTGIAVLVFGLIVYFNLSVIQAFEMAKSGATREQILRRFVANSLPPNQPPPG